MVTYAKISRKMVNPRHIAGEREEEERSTLKDLLTICTSQVRWTTKLKTSFGQITVVSIHRLNSYAAGGLN